MNKIKTYGEVFTPKWLVNDMMDTLPKEVWSNPDLKWLDPCCGKGIFSEVIIERLKSNGIDEQHILENMLYVCELQEESVEEYKQKFNPDNKYNINVTTGSYLDIQYDKFDIIVMNPPYQKMGLTGTKTSPLWDKFVVKTINDLKEGGYLVPVHPSGWRDVSGRFKYIQELLKSKQVLYLEVHNVKDALKTFKVSTTYDFYCLKNTPNDNTITEIKCMDGKTEYRNLKDMEFIPNGMFDLIEKLLWKE